MLYIIRFAAQDVVHFRRTISVRTEIRCSEGNFRVIAIMDAGFGEHQHDPSHQCWLFRYAEFGLDRLQVSTETRSHSAV